MCSHAARPDLSACGIHSSLGESSPPPTLTLFGANATSAWSISHGQVRLDGPLSCQKRLLILSTLVNFLNHHGLHMEARVTNQQAGCSESHQPALFSLHIKYPTNVVKIAGNSAEASEHPLWRSQHSRQTQQEAPPSGPPEHDACTQCPFHRVWPVSCHDRLSSPVFPGPLSHCVGWFCATHSTRQSSWHTHVYTDLDAHKHTNTQAYPTDFHIQLYTRTHPAIHTLPQREPHRQPADNNARPCPTQQAQLQDTDGFHGSHNETNGSMLAWTNSKIFFWL